MLSLTTNSNARVTQKNKKWSRARRLNSRDLIARLYFCTCAYLRFKGGQFNEKKKFYNLPYNFRGYSFYLAPKNQ